MSLSFDLAAIRRSCSSATCQDEQDRLYIATCQSSPCQRLDSEKLRCAPFSSEKLRCARFSTSTTSGNMLFSTQSMELCWMRTDGQFRQERTPKKIFQGKLDRVYGAMVTVRVHPRKSAKLRRRRIRISYVFFPREDD